ncbi:MAG: hypothetical protein WC840_02770 [Candidatus Peribacteraceae bacterium]
MSLRLKTKMHFIPPQPGSFEEMRKYLDAGTSEVLGGWGQKEQKTWIHEWLFTCHYEYLGRSEKGLVRQFLQNVTGYSRAQIAREIAAYNKLGKSAPTQQDSPAEEAAVAPVSEAAPVPATEAPQAVQQTSAQLTVTLMHPQEKSILWPLIRRFLIVSSIITNIAFVAMLLGMSLLERAEKVRERNPVLALPPAIESTEQPIHAAPPLRPASAEASAGRQGFEGQASYAPMP